MPRILPVRVRADRRPHRGRVALGGRGHRFLPRVGERCRPARLQRDQPDQRLQRHVDLGAEAAAGRRRHDAHLLRRQAEHQRRVVAVHMRRLRAGGNHQRVAIHAREAGLRLDIGVLDIGGLDRRRRRHAPRVASAASGSPRSTNPLVRRLPARLSCRRAAPSFDRIARFEHMRLLAPFDREAAEVETGDRRALAGDQRDRLAAEPHEALGQRRLVGEGRYRAETVLPRNVGRREYRDDPRMLAHEGCEIAEAEARAIMRRAHHQHRQRIGGKAIAAKFFRARHFRHAVEPDRRRADRLARLRAGRVSRSPSCRHASITAVMILR